MEETLKILDFNCKSVLTCGPIFKELENSIDMFLLQEHWLYDCQLSMINEISDHLTGFGKAVDTLDPISATQMPRGYGGTAILWKKYLDSIISPSTIGNERIQGIEVTSDPNLILLSVCLPCKGSYQHLSDFQDYIAQLHEIVSTYKQTHQII
ncbi:unnamed protein product [Mytilus edulis]|uniref:Uncharacterized protein n=1 Tax=Mytilus edulis TaxID=6550 RepID=A0A8S3QR51_MYTED|nr:unnamed protein product [Mytilus edulis]